MWSKTLQKSPYTMYIWYFSAKYRMEFKFLNFELQLLCAINCKKISKCIGNQQCYTHLYFSGQHYSFQEFFQTLTISFSRLFKALKTSTLNSRTFRTFPGSVRTLYMGWNLISSRKSAKWKFIYLFKINNRRIRAPLIPSEVHRKYTNGNVQQRKTNTWMRPVT